MTQPGKTSGPSFFQDALKLILGNFTHLFMALLVGIATARIWGAEVRGIITTVLIVPSLLVNFGDLGIDKALPALMNEDRDQRARVVGVSFTLWVFASLLYSAMAAAWFFSPWASQMPGDWFALAVAAIAPTLHLAFARGVALADEEVAFIAKRFWFSDPFKLGVILILGWAMGLAGWVYFFAALIEGLVGFAMGIALIRKRYPIRFVIDFPLIGKMIKSAFYYGFSTVLMRLNYRIDLFIITLAAMGVANAERGNYSVGVNFANMLWQVPIALSFVLFSRSVNSNDPAAFARKTARLCRFGLAVGVPAAVVTFFAAPWVLPLAYGPDFTLAATCTQILLPGIVAFFVARTLEADLQAKGRPWLVSAVMLPVVVANIVLNLLWVPAEGVSWAPAHGVLGAAWASTITYIVGTLGLVGVYCRATGIKWWDILIPRPGDFRIRFIRSRR